MTGDPLTRPILGILVGLDTPDPLRALLLEASRRARPIACSALEAAPTPPPAAYVWSGNGTLPPAGVPYAAWVEQPADLETPASVEATVLLCPSVRLRDLAGERGLLVPASATFPRGARPMSPFVRRRLRAARGLPRTVLAHGDGVVWHWDDDPDPLPSDLVDTAAGCASAVVATGAALATALAWAAPTVTDAASAAMLHLTAGDHVLVAADPAERSRLAGELARDEARAARLGGYGRLAAREHADLRHAAWTMLRALGLPSHPYAGRLGPLEDQLDALGTPDGAPARLRSRSLVAPLPKRARAEGE